MARQPKLRKKSVGRYVYWFTKTGGDTNFGRVDEVPHQQAQKLFADHLSRIFAAEKDSKRQFLTVGELMDLFLDWVQKNRSENTYRTRRNYCSRFGNFRVGKHRVANLPADKIKGEDLEGWLEALTEEELEPQTRLHAETSVRCCWNWATKHPSPTPYLPSIFRPFSAVERTHVPLKPLTEEDLITDQEIKAVLSAANLDLDQFRRHGLKKTVERKGVNGLSRIEGEVGCFGDVLKCYLHTGARTDELASCLNKHVQIQTKQVLLGQHKNARKKGIVRQVILNEETLAIFSRHCQGKGLEDHVFLNQEGNPWTSRSLAKRFARVKEVAAALQFGAVRKEITIYDFRHLWISDALATTDIAMVAKMAGTSVSVIEKVYGHFRNDQLHEAQGRLDQTRKDRGL